MRMKHSTGIILAVSAVMILSMNLQSQAGGKGTHHPTPSAMHYSDYENNGYGVNPWAGYENDPDTVMINPRRSPTPYQYRKWHNRALEDTMGVKPPMGSYRFNRTPKSKARIARAEAGYGLGIGIPGYGIGSGAIAARHADGCQNCEDTQNESGATIQEEKVDPKAQPVAPAKSKVDPQSMYQKSNTSVAYSQQYIADDFCCGEEVIMDYCPDYCCEVPAKKRCFLDGFKKLFSFKSFCKKSKFSCDPWYSCDPCFTCCDPCFTCCDPCFSCCDPCMGGFGGTMVSSGSSCCGGGDMGDMGVSGDLVVESQGNAPTPAPGVDSAAPTQVPAPAQQKANDKLNVPSYPALPEKAPAAPAVPANPPAAVPGSTGVIRMMVPEDAVVYINGYQTKLSGIERNFTANNLEDGEAYDFEVRVVAMQKGQMTEQVKTTTLIGGKTAALAFMQYDTNVAAVALR